MANTHQPSNLIIFFYVLALFSPLSAQTVHQADGYEVDMFPVIGGPVPAWADETRIWSPLWRYSWDGAPTPFGSFLGLEVLISGKTDDLGVCTVIISDDQFRTPEGFDMCTRIEDLIAAEDALVAISQVWKLLYFHLESGWKVYFEYLPIVGYQIHYF